jgi:hypothetical protein
LRGERSELKGKHGSFAGSRGGIVWVARACVLFSIPCICSALVFHDLTRIMTQYNLTAGTTWAVGLHFLKQAGQAMGEKLFSFVDFGCVGGEEHRKRVGHKAEQSGNTEYIELSSVVETKSFIWSWLS